MIEEKDILSLFDEVVQQEENKKKYISKHHLKEQEKLNILHEFNENNIEDIFNKISDIKEDIELESIVIGKEYYRFKVLEMTQERSNNGCFSYKCICLTCNKESLMTSRDIKSTKTKKCRRCNELSIGQKFNSWIIIEKLPSDEKGNRFYKCLCVCGNTGIILGTMLNRGRSKQCKDCGRKSNAHKLASYNKVNKRIKHDDVKKGMIFGSRTIINETVKYSPHGMRLVECQCECGDIKWIVYGDLLRNISHKCKSCAVKNYERK